MFRRYCCLLIFFLFAKNVVFAQTDYGLGDPAIYFFFDSGTSVIGPPLPGYSEFVYQAGVPDYGHYTRFNNSSINANWWPAKDHTDGDGDNGYMMTYKPPIGASNQVFFQAPVYGLCSGTTYEISAFLLNLSKNLAGIQPRIKIRVVDEATQNQIAESGVFPALPKLTQNATDADWVRHLFQFTVPPGVSNIRFAIMCETAGAPDLDEFAIDDVTLNATGQKIELIHADGQQGDTIIACSTSPTKFLLRATPPIAGNEIRWQRKLAGGAWTEIAGATTSDYEIESSTTPGLWSYRAASGPPGQVSAPKCNVVSNEVYVRVNEGVTASAGADKFYLRGGAAVMLEGSSNSADVTWEVVDGDDITSLTSATVARPFASPDVTTIYKLTARSDANTCGGPTPPSFVKVVVADEIELPNTFTPNADGINDRWVIGGINSYPNPIVRVFNRSGQLVFRTAGTISPWDGTYNGKAVPAGSYYYIIDLGINGLKRSGSVAVLR